MKMIAMAVDGQGFVHLAATRAPDLWRRDLSRATGGARLAFVAVAPSQLTAETVLARLAERLGRQADPAHFDLAWQDRLERQRRLARQGAVNKGGGSDGSACVDAPAGTFPGAADTSDAPTRNIPAVASTWPRHALVYRLDPDRILRALQWELGGALRLSGLARFAGRARRRLTRPIGGLAHQMRRFIDPNRH
jgi:hypothetical protein